MPFKEGRHIQGDGMEPLNLPRRRFLKVALATATGVGLATGGVFRKLASYKDSGETFETDFGRLLVLKDKHANLVYAFADAMLPKGEGFPTPAEAKVVERMDEELYFVAPSIRADLRMALDVMNLLPFFYGRMSTFLGLDSADRLAFLQETQATKSDTVRAVVNALRLLVSIIYYGHESTWKPIGYDGSFGRFEPQVSVQRAYYANLTGRAP